MQRLTPLIALAILFLAPAAFAQDGMTASRYTVSGTTGFDNGGLYLGADFEFRNKVAHGFGGYAFFFQKKDAETEVVGQPGVNAFGGFFRAHFNRARWEFAVAPGFGIVNMDEATLGGDAEMAFGPSLQMEVVTQVTSSFALGFNFVKFYSWFNEKMAHDVKESLGLRLRFSI